MPIKELEKCGENKGICVGDYVAIVNSGETFSTYSKWVAANIKDPRQVAEYRYGISPNNGLVGIVIYVAPHEFGHTDCAYIETTEGYYLIGVRGLLRIHGVEILED